MPIRCLNCKSLIAEHAEFCQRCGQRANTARRLTFADIFRDLMHTFVNFERGPLAFAWSLLIRPGLVAQEYIEGRRRRHYGPFATLAVVAGVAALVTDLSGFRPLANVGLAEGPTKLLQHHLNLLLLLQLPFVAGACATLFRSAKMTLPEHLVLAAYTLSVQAVVLVGLLTIAYADATMDAQPGYVYAFWLVWYFYYGWTASKFYTTGATWRLWIKGSIAAALGHAVLVASIFALGAVYDTEKTRLWPAHGHPVNLPKAGP
jgi:Protein of unknown function (DUF3667)